MKTAIQINIIDRIEYMILDEMIKDRNMTSHTYNEALAEQISGHINEYYDTIIAIVACLEIIDK